MKYVAQFSKKGRMAYISHLDTQRLFLRVLRMAGAKPAYSGGFNPHPKLSLALPLSTGFSSDREYLEFETEAPLDDLDAVARKIGEHLPDGIELSHLSERVAAEAMLPRAGGAARRSENLGGKSLASRVRFAQYEIIAPLIANAREAAAEYARRETILVERENRKTGMRSTTDIRPMIRAFECVRTFNRFAVYRCTLSSGGDRNLNPLVAMTSFYDSKGEALDPSQVDVRRTNILFA